MKSAEYETLVGKIGRRVFETVEGDGAGSLRVGRSNLWRGQSGFKHQIDVSIEGPHDVVIVECKLWRTRVKVEHVLVLWGRIADIQLRIDKRFHAILATTVGLQRGAQVVARHFGIKLAVVKSAEKFSLRYRDTVHAASRISGGGGVSTSGVATRPEGRLSRGSE